MIIGNVQPDLGALDAGLGEALLRHKRVHAWVPAGPRLPLARQSHREPRRREKAERLYRLTPTATFVALAPYIGTIEACAVASGEA